MTSHADARSLKILQKGWEAAASFCYIIIPLSPCTWVDVPRCPFLWPLCNCATFIIFIWCYYSARQSHLSGQTKLELQVSTRIILEKACVCLLLHLNNKIERLLAVKSETLLCCTKEENRAIVWNLMEHSSKSIPESWRSQNNTFFWLLTFSCFTEQ